MFIAFPLLSFLLKKKDAMIPCGVVNSTCKSVVYGMKHGPLSYRLVLPVKLSRPCTMHQATSSVWKHNIARKISLHLFFRRRGHCHAAIFSQAHSLRCRL